MKRFILLFVFAVMLVFASCIKPPNYPETPYIEYVSVNKTSFTEVDNDSIKVTIYFEDGDGDLGGNVEDSVNMFLEDSRVPGIFLPFKIPFITLQGNHDDISGNIYLTYKMSCLNIANDVDTVSFRYYIKDRAGHQSNFISTPDLTVVCN